MRQGRSMTALAPSNLRLRAVINRPTGQSLFCWCRWRRSGCRCAASRRRWSGGGCRCATSCRRGSRGGCRCATSCRWCRRCRARSSSWSRSGAFRVQARFDFVRDIAFLGGVNNGTVRRGKIVNDAVSFFGRQIVHGLLCHFHHGT